MAWWDNIVDPIADTAKDIYYGNYEWLGAPQEYVRGAMNKSPRFKFSKQGDKWVSDVPSKPKAGSKTGVTVGTQGTRGITNPRMFEESNKGATDFLGRLTDYFNVPSGGLGEEVPSGGANPLAQLFSGLFSTGGGGGGDSAALRRLAMEQQAATNAASGILDMIKSGSYRQPYSQMRSTLADYLAQAQKNIGGAYGGASSAVQQAFAQNPYADLVGTSTAAEPALQALLQSQGVSTDPLAQLVAANREASQQRAGAFTDLAKMMAANYGAAGSRAASDVGTMQANTLADLLSLGGAYEGQIGQQEAAALSALQKSLTEQAAKGADIGALLRRYGR